jgi:hypothetical protein
METKQRSTETLKRLGADLEQTRRIGALRRREEARRKQKGATLIRDDFEFGIYLLTKNCSHILPVSLQPLLGVRKWE